jgi:NO-binding membrane sensor protein with MHYT domain
MVMQTATIAKKVTVSLSGIAVSAHQVASRIAIIAAVIVTMSIKAMHHHLIEGMNCVRKSGINNVIPIIPSIKPIDHISNLILERLLLG